VVASVVLAQKAVRFAQKSDRVAPVSTKVVALLEHCAQHHKQQQQQQQQKQAAETGSRRTAR
jgi:hypothetical protein